MLVSKGTGIVKESFDAVVDLAASDGQVVSSTSSPSS